MVPESAGTATLTVQLSDAFFVLPGVTVNYQAIPGTATSSDYTLASGKLTFSPFQPRQVGAHAHTACATIAAMHCKCSKQDNACQGLCELFGRPAMPYACHTMTA